MCEQGLEVPLAGLVDFLITRAPRSISSSYPSPHSHLGATNGSSRRTPATHPSSNLLVGLRVSAPSTDSSGKLFSTPNEVCSTQVDLTMFSSEIDAPTPKGVTASFGVATRNSRLQCTVLTFPASSFTSYAGMPSAPWQTTTYSVSLHQSLTFHFPWYVSFFIRTTSPGTNCTVLVAQS